MCHVTVVYECLYTYLKLEAALVDGYGVLSGVVLHGAGEEGLREEEAREPEDGGFAVVVPVLQELEPGQEICDVATQRLEARV